MLAKHSPFISGPAAEVEAVPRAHSASSATPLLQVGMRGPHCGVVSKIVVRGEQLHFGPEGGVVRHFGLGFITTVRGVRN